MLRTDLKNGEGHSLRIAAAKGDSVEVQKILERNKGVNSFDVNNPSGSNGNTALHWACSKVMEIKQGYSEKYAKTIRLLIKYGADPLIENKSGQKPRDFFTKGEEGSAFVNPLRIGLRKDSAYVTLISALLGKECTKITYNPEELDGELAIAMSFYSIIDGLQLIDFFPPEIKQQDTFIILSLACLLSSEIIPLIVYFQHYNKQVRYIGVDINNDLIEDNKVRYKNYKNVDLICADPSDLDVISDRLAPCSVDVGIMRDGDFSQSHGRLDRSCKIVDQIFPGLLKPLAPLLMTFQTQEELDVCRLKTQLDRNFAKFKGGNSYDVGKRCSFTGQYKNTPITVNPDRFGFILNLDKPNANQDQLSHALQRLGM